MSARTTDILMTAVTIVLFIVVMVAMGLIVSNH